LRDDLNSTTTPQESINMARKGNNPDKMDTEKETGSKRRYQSPQTPPQAPRSSPRTQQRPEQGRGQEERKQDDQDLDTEAFGEGQSAGRGTSQEYGQDELQGRGLVDREQGAQGAHVGQEGGQDWQDDMDEEGITGGYAARGSDFDLQKASRDELNAIAQELDIEEYETMNREELVMEIRERS
jgi:hypothetical protein